MLSSTSGASPSPPQPPQRSQINNSGSSNVTVLTSGDNNQVSIIQGTTDEEDVELDSLLDRYVSKDAFRASLHSPPECHPDTRTTIRNEICGWIDERESKKSPLLWINGPVGVGKSVIAKTISGDHNHEVVATFFFSTTNDRNAATLFPTLAWQLAQRIPETRKHIIASLKKGYSLQTSQLEAQFDLLIVQPLKKITASLTYRPVIVIDGVDECTDDHMLAQFLKVLVQAGKRSDMPVRFIICSRPEPRIRAILGMEGVLPDVNPTTNGQQPQSPRLVYRKSVVAMASIGLNGLIASTSMIAFTDSKASSSSESPRINLGLLTVSIASITLLALIALLPYSPSSEAHLPTPLSGRFLQGVWELYRPVRLGVDKDAPSFPTSDRHVDIPEMSRYPLISAIEIGFSNECRKDIAKYLTDSFNAIRKRDGTSWFQQNNISEIVEASCGQFLYASTIVKLLEESCDDPREILNMARDSCLPTPDLNKLYQSILKRALKNIQDQAKEGGPSCQKERRFLMDSLAILVFFAGNIQFFTVRKSFQVIETLLGIEEGKLTFTLRKMHSVLRIAPEETIQVHHRSFLEFLQNQERSGEYYIGYSNALGRVLILMTRTGLRYLTIRINRRSDLGCVEDMITQCHLNFFGRSKSPFILRFLHLSIHISLVFALCMLFFSRLFPLSKYLTGPVQFLSVMVFFLSVIGTFILSLTIYIFFYNRSIVVPFFHPFLHPLFMGGFLFRLRLMLFMLFALTIIAVLIPILVRRLLYPDKDHAEILPGSAFEEETQFADGEEENGDEIDLEPQFAYDDEPEGEDEGGPESISGGGAEEEDYGTEEPH